MRLRRYRADDARRQREAELEANQEVHVAQRALRLLLLPLVLPLLLLLLLLRSRPTFMRIFLPRAPSSRVSGPGSSSTSASAADAAARREATAARGTATGKLRGGGGRRAPPRPAFAGLAHQRPGPELKLRLSHRRGARERERRAREAHHARDDNINLPTTCTHEHNNTAHPLSDSLPLSLHNGTPQRHFTALFRHRCASPLFSSLCIAETIYAQCIAVVFPTWAKKINFGFSTRASAHQTVVDKCR